MKLLFCIVGLLFFRVSTMIADNNEQLVSFIPNRSLEVSVSAMQPCF